MKNEMNTVWKRAVVVLFGLLFPTLPGGTQEKPRKEGSVRAEI